MNMAQSTEQICVSVFSNFDQIRKYFEKMFLRKKCVANHWQNLKTLHWIILVNYLHFI